MKIATTTGDFLWYAEQWDVCSILTMMAESGVKHVDLNLGGAMVPGKSPLCSDKWEQWADDIGNTAVRLGLDFVQAHSSDTVYERGEKRDYLTSMIIREFEVCQKLDIPGMVVHGILNPSGDRGEFMVKNAEFYHELLPIVEKTGVQMFTENGCHQNTPLAKLFYGEDINELCGRVNHPLFGVCWDVGHSHLQGVDQYKEIVTMGSNLRAVHIHDNYNYAVKDLHIQPFGGNCCYDAIINGLLDIGFKGAFTLEAFSMPVASNFCFCNRKPFVLDGVVYDKVLMPPLDIKIRSERLMMDTARFMLEAYNCYED